MEGNNVVNDEIGIWPPYEAFYIESMFFCSLSGFRSIHRVNSILGKFHSETESDQSTLEDTLLFELQNIIQQSGALSRYFWPARSKSRIHSARAEKLRQAFFVDESSPLKSRELRNSIEHFDEKLDLYVADGIVGHILPKYVGTGPTDTEIPTHIFRAYYVDTGIFELLGNRFHIEAMVNELLRIHEKLIEFEEAGFRLPVTP